MSTVTTLARLLIFFVLTVSGHIFADEVRPAYLEISEKRDQENSPYAEILWKQPVVQNRRLPIDPVFDESCDLVELQNPTVTGTALIKRWSTECDLFNSKIEITGLSTSITDVLVRVQEHGEVTKTFVLRPTAPVLDLSQNDLSATSYLIIGLEHLVFGIDHVLFVIGLVLFIHQPLMLLKTITAFTVAHSITLALSIFEIVQLRQEPVEAIIALSILFLAYELAKPESVRSVLTKSTPWAMAFVFGLLHGLGFAGALTEIGLPEDSLATSLFLFNVGIELGQVLVVLIFASIAWVWSKIARTRRLNPETFHRISAYAMGGLATYWTIDRTLLII